MALEIKLEIMISMKLFYVPVVILGLSLFFGCSKKEEESGLGKHNIVNPVVHDNLLCKGMKAIYIYKDGSTAISKNSENSWVSWNIDSLEVEARGFDLDALDISEDGRFAITKVSQGQIYLLRLLDGAYKVHKRLWIENADKIEVDFNENFLILKRKSYYPRNTYSIKIYDIDRGQFLSDFNLSRVKFVKIKDEHIYIAQEIDWKKSLSKFSLKTNENVFTIELPYYLTIKRLEVSSTNIILESGKGFEFFSLNNGKKLFDSNFKYLYQLDSKKTVGLFAKSWTEFSLVSLEDGRELYSLETPRNLIISSCRIKTNPVKLVCKDRVEQNKVITWNLESGENSLACY